MRRAHGESARCQLHPRRMSPCGCAPSVAANDAWACSGFVSRRRSSAASKVPTVGDAVLVLGLMLMLVRVRVCMRARAHMCRLVYTLVRGLCAHGSVLSQAHPSPPPCACHARPSPPPPHREQTSRTDSARISSPLHQLQHPPTRSYTCVRTILLRVLPPSPLGLYSSALAETAIARPPLWPAGAPRQYLILTFAARAAPRQRSVTGPVSSRLPGRRESRGRGRVKSPVCAPQQRG